MSGKRSVANFYPSERDQTDIYYSRASWLRKSHPDWINVPTLIVDCVSVAIAFIPEGLPIALTASLTICANLMKKNKVLCKSLKTVETLGAVSVICSDKTGTLTKVLSYPFSPAGRFRIMRLTIVYHQNEMYVTACAIGTTSMTPEAAQDKITMRRHDPTTSSNAADQLRAIAGLCNSAEFDAASSHRPLHERKINGDATDQAVLRFSESLGEVAYLKAFWKKEYELAFNSKNKFMIRTYSLLDTAGLGFTVALNEERNFNPDDV